MKIGIVGGGLIGRLIAWKALSGGHKVTIFDQSWNLDGSAAIAAAAMLAPFSESVICPREIYEMGLKSLSLWPQLINEIETVSNIPVYFQQNGTIAIAHKRDRSSLAEFISKVSKVAMSVSGSLRKLNLHDLAELEPELSPQFDEGVFLPFEGSLDNRELLQALATAIIKLDGQIIESYVKGLINESSIEIDSRRFNFDVVIDTRGFKANTQFEDLRGVRGEIIWVRAPEVGIKRPVRLMHPRYNLYIAPKRDNIYAVGATEIESESLAPVTVRSSLELLSSLYSVHPGFAEASIIHQYARCRPAYFDNLPKILVNNNCIHVNGLYRHGYMISPYILNTAMEVINGKTDNEIVRVQ